MPSTTTLICEKCGKEFNRKTLEHNRSLKKKQRIFCSRKCSASEHLPPAVRYKDPETVAFKFMLTKARKNAKQCERKVLDLTLEDLKEVWSKQEHKCIYSGIELTLPIQYKSVWNDPIYTASLDRIDSSKGYIRGNIQFTSIILNKAKGDMSHERMLEFCNTMKR